MKNMQILAIGALLSGLAQACTTVQVEKITDASGEGYQEISVIRDGGSRTLYERGDSNDNWRNPANHDEWVQFGNDGGAWNGQYKHPDFGKSLNTWYLGDEAPTLADHRSLSDAVNLQQMSLGGLNGQNGGNGHIYWCLWDNIGCSGVCDNYADLRQMGPRRARRSARLGM